MGYAVDWQLLLNCLTVAAFVMSALTWIKTIISNHFDVSISIEDCIKFTDSANFFVFIDNRSRLPIAITKIRIAVNGEYKSCWLEPRAVKGFKLPFDSINSINDVYKSLHFPINLLALGASGGYLVLPECPDIVLTDGTPLSFEIRTNRGIIKTLQIPQMTGKYFLGGQGTTR